MSGARKRSADVRASAASVEQLQGTANSISDVAVAQAPNGVAVLAQFTSGRRFLIWPLMAGYVPPQRVVERIVAEVEAGVL